MVRALAIPPGLVSGFATMLLTVHWTGTVSLGVAILSVLAGLATVTGVIYGVRWKIAYEVECKAREGERALNEALEDRLRTVVHERDEFSSRLSEATHTITDAEKTIARLEALPNLERVIELFSNTFERFADRFERANGDGERAADERAARIISEIQALNQAV